MGQGIKLQSWQASGELGGELVRKVTWFTEEVKPVSAACFAESEAGRGTEASAGHLRREGQKLGQE